MSIDPLTWHLVLVLISVGLAYLANMGLKKLLPAVSFPVYGLALIFGAVIQLILRLIRMDDYVDKRVITRIGSTATDYLVAFGVASINISIVLKYWLPILILAVLGTLFALSVSVLCKYFFRTFWFERFLYIFGMSTGVMSTGVILLRITDPEFKSGVLDDFGFAWIFLSVIDMIVVSVSPVFVMKGLGWLIGLIFVAASVFCVVLSGILFGIQKDKGNVMRPGEEERLSS